MNKKLAIVLTVFTLFVSFWLKFTPYLPFFGQKFNFQAIDHLYKHSQFAANPDDRQLVILDWDLYPYAGLIYLKTGKIDQINIEHPPLGKYLFGLSLILFKNSTIIQIPLALLFLYLSFFLGLKLLKNPWWAFLVPLAMLNEVLFTQHTIHSTLDLFQSTTILLFVYLAGLDKLNKKTPFILGVVLGIVASIKFPASALILALSCTIFYLAANKDKKIKSLLIVFSIALLFYLLNYLPLFIKSKSFGQGFSDFVSLQIRALKIHLSHLPEYKPLAPLKVMFLNQWPSWWDKANPVVQVEEWSYRWPILALSMFLSPWLYYYSVIKKKKKNLQLIFFFAWLYFIFINSRLFFPSYLLPLLPFLYLFLVAMIKYLASVLVKITKVSKLIKLANFSKKVSPK